jgi:hypothetical protein
MKTTADSEFFYEKEAEYFGFTPFQFLDSVGEIVVKAVFGMFERVTGSSLLPNAPFLTKGQVEAVSFYQFERFKILGCRTMVCLG